MRYCTVASLAAFLLVAAANQDRVHANANLLLAIVLGLLVLLYFALFLVVRHGQRITRAGTVPQSQPAAGVDGRGAP